MITTQPEPLAITTTARLLPGWHRFAALLARHDLARTLRKVGEQAASRGVFTVRRLDIAVIWLLPGVQDADEPGVDGADGVGRENPAGRCRGGVFVGEVSPVVGEVPDVSLRRPR